MSHIGWARGTGAGPPGPSLAADYEQAVAEDHIAVLQPLLVCPNLKLDVSVKKCKKEPLYLK